MLKAKDDEPHTNSTFILHLLFDVTHFKYTDIYFNFDGVEKYFDSQLGR